MNIQGMSLGPLGANCYIVFKGKEALIIDPGSEPEAIVHAIDQLELKPQAILLTHAHFDHIGALDEIRKRYQIEVYIHEDEKDWLQDAGLNRSRLFTGEDIVTFPAEHHLLEGKMNVGSFSLEVLHTPGHSPGSVSFVFHEDEKVISGDALFFQGIGRTDLPGGDRDVLENSIKNNLYQLPDTYTVYPGHGPNTTIGSEKRNNPFVYSR